MEIHVIKTEEDYKNALSIIDNLMDSSTGSEGADKLDLLSLLVESYESKHYKIDTPDPIVAIQQRIDQLGLSRKDLEKTIGSRSRVSEILNKKRTLTLAMIRKLHKHLNIPADILIK